MPTPETQFLMKLSSGVEGAEDWFIVLHHRCKNRIFAQDIVIIKTLVATTNFPP